LSSSSTKSAARNELDELYPTTISSLDDMPSCSLRPRAAPQIAILSESSSRFLIGDGMTETMTENRQVGKCRQKTNPRDSRQTRERREKAFRQLSAREGCRATRREESKTKFATN
jgi:hypothetical protein